MSETCAHSKWNMFHFSFSFCSNLVRKKEQQIIRLQTISIRFDPVPGLCKFAHQGVIKIKVWLRLIKIWHLRFEVKMAGRGRKIILRPLNKMCQGSG